MIPENTGQRLTTFEGFGWQNEDSGGFFLGGWGMGGGVTRLNLPLRGDIAQLHMGLNGSHDRHGSFLVS